MNTGGASGVYARLNMKNWKGKTRDGFLNEYSSSNYRMVYNKAELNRLDWYGFQEDAYGRVIDIGKHGRGTGFVRGIEKIKEGILHDNEVIFHHGLSLKNLSRIECKGQADQYYLKKSYRHWPYLTMTTDYHHHYF